MPRRFGSYVGNVGNCAKHGQHVFLCADSEDCMECKNRFEREMGSLFVVQWDTLAHLSVLFVRHEMGVSLALELLSHVFPFQTISSLHQVNNKPIATKEFPLQSDN